MKIVIIGGVAAGSKVAAKSRRILADAEIDIYTEDTYVSYSSCGIPYYIEGNFQDYKNLIVRTPEEFQKNNINVHTKHLVTKIKPESKIIVVKNLDTNDEFEVGYDKLIVATGAKPYIPNIKNVHLKNVFTLRTLEDGIAIRNQMKKSRHITIIGGGYIGIELLEAFVENKIQTTLIEKSDHVLSMLDEDIAKEITEYIFEKSSNLVKLIPNDHVVEFVGEDKVKEVIMASGIRFKTDMVLLSTGIRPVIDIAVDAGIELGETGAIKVNKRMETNIPDIYACGDCVEKTHLITQKQVWIPLGSNANKEGRCAAINACGGEEYFDGVLGSAVTRYFCLTISSTGLTEKQAKEAGFDPISSIVRKRDKPKYMPQAHEINIKLVADRNTHRILGAQAIGCGDADKRINTLVTGLTEKIRLEDLLGADITYAPPFSTSIDPLLTAARKLYDKILKEKSDT